MSKITARTIDTGEIAALLGLCRSHVTNRLVKRPDFPPPVINLSRRTRRWLESDVINYAAGKRGKARLDDYNRAATSSPVSR